MNNRKHQQELQKLNKHLVAYATQGKWEERYTQFYDDFFAEAASLLNENQEEFENVLMASFYKPMIFNVLFELFLTTCWDNEELSMAGEYLKARGWRESAYARRYLQALNVSEFKLWEVVSVKSKVSVDVKPFQSEGETIRVYEKSGSQGMRQWDCLGASVVKVDDRYGFTGALLSFTPDEAQAIEPFFEQCVQCLLAELKENHDIEELGTEEELEAEIRQDVKTGMPLLVLQLWVSKLYSRLSVDPFEIKMVNKDGDQLQPVILRYSVKAQQAESIRQILNSAELLDFSEEDGEWIWLAEAVQKDHKASVAILGSLSLIIDRLELQVNSSQRADKGKKYIAALLGNLVDEPLTVFERLDLSEGFDLEEPKSPLLPEDFNGDEVIKSFMDQHYQKILDEPIPALGHKTPRECANDTDQHVQLIQWLKGLDNDTLHAGPMPDDYNFQWMWEELGLVYPADIALN